MYGTNGSKNLLKKMYHVLSANVIKGAIVSVFSKSFILSMYCFYNYKKTLKKFFKLVSQYAKLHIKKHFKNIMVYCLVVAFKFQITYF